MAFFSVQAERVTEHSRSEIESCLCYEIIDNSANNPCSTVSFLFFSLERLNVSNDTLIFDRAAFVDYKSYLLRQHRSRLFRPPIVYSLT